MAQKVLRMAVRRPRGGLPPGSPNRAKSVT